MANGYAMNCFEEAWWCCVHEAGLAMTQYARHVVTCSPRGVRVNFLVPGTFAVTLPDGSNAEIKIQTAWPSAAAATITATGLPRDLPIHVRVPTSVVAPQVSETRDGNMACLTLGGRIGHHLVNCGPHVMLMYGPLVLAHQRMVGTSRHEKRLPMPQFLPVTFPNRCPLGRRRWCRRRRPTLTNCSSSRPDRCQSGVIEEGPGTRCWVEGAAVNVPLKFPSGETITLRLWPLCANTSNLTLHETPLVFRREMPEV